MPTTPDLVEEQPTTGQERRTSIGVILAERVYAVVAHDGKAAGAMVRYPDGPAPADADEDDSLVELPTEALVKAIADTVEQLSAGHRDDLGGIGLALPGLVNHGVVDEAPNLPQLKGAHVEALLAAELASRGIKVPVCALNDADAMAAGLASTHGKLDHKIRVWTLGTGIGYGVYPFTPGVWEGGHTVVTLDEKENYCGCGGKGHLEGIMGHRAMRLRFLDMEPEEVFEAANRKPNPDARCLEFKRLWHRAMAAATASSIHVSGGGKFYFTGYNVRFLDLSMLKEYLSEMVKMSCLQNYSLEIVEDAQSVRALGAAVAGLQQARC
ncbi:MAG: ROK family protein [Acidobacteriaceae bacterium]|nr:ROK family protein [Acidobacteriaceae bacterium]